MIHHALTSAYRIQYVHSSVGAQGLGRHKKPQIDVARYKNFAFQKFESGKNAQLVVNVLLIFLHERFSCQHVRGGRVSWANVDDSEKAAAAKDPLCFMDYSSTTRHGHFVEAIHNCDKVKREIRELSVLCIAKLI